MNETAEQDPFASAPPPPPIPDQVPAMEGVTVTPAVEGELPGSDVPEEEQPVADPDMAPDEPPEEEVETDVEGSDPDPAEDPGGVSADVSAALEEPIPEDPHEDPHEEQELPEDPAPDPLPEPSDLGPDPEAEIDLAGNGSKHDRPYVVLEQIEVEIEGVRRIAWIRIGRVIARNGDVAVRRAYRALAQERGYWPETTLLTPAERMFKPVPMRYSEELVTTGRIVIGDDE